MNRSIQMKNAGSSELSILSRCRQSIVHRVDGVLALQQAVETSPARIRFRTLHWPDEERRRLNSGNLATKSNERKPVARRQASNNGLFFFDAGFATGIRNLLFQRLRFVFADRLLNGNGSVFDNVFRIVKIKSRDFHHNLDHRDLLCPESV